MANSVNMAKSYDVVIIGAGMAGLSLLHLLRKSIENGLKVALIERFELPSLNSDADQPPSFDGRY